MPVIFYLWVFHILNILEKMKKLAYLEIASHFAWSNKLFGRTKRDYCLEMQVDDVACNESKFNLKKHLSKTSG